LPFQPTRAMIGSPGVNLAIRDAINPSDIAFDVGAFSGWLSALMSRMVGPLGRVVAFEADPGNLDACTGTLLQLASSNYTVVHAAVCDRMGIAEFFVNDTNRQTSSLLPVHPEQCRTVRVPALTLDAYISANRLAPSFIKIDVERAELAVLKGAANYIALRKPLLVLEQTPGDLRCAEFLTRLGYFAVDVADYEPFYGRTYPPHCAIADVLYYHPETSRLRPEAFTREPVVTVDEPDQRQSLAGIECAPIDLPPGRYVVEPDFIPRSAGLVSQRLRAGDRLLTKEDGLLHWVWRSFRRIPVHLHEPGSLTLEYLPIRQGEELAMTITRIRVFAVPGLNRAMKINEI
jgi:FkbM family methyltransferase